MNTDAIAKRMAWLACCALTATVYAMPTKDELAQAQRLVNDLTADDLRALKSKEKTPGDVAAAHLALADEADTEAGKYLLLQGAFRLYARSGDYDAAAATLQRMRGEIADLPPEVIVEIVNSEMRRVAATKAPKVLAIFRDAQRIIKYRKQLAAAELDATAHPENVRYQRRVAECHACLGDWQKALPIFAKLGDVAAKWELGTAKDCDATKAADFWWNYKTTDPEPFKAHAASLYRAALDANQVSGLRREVAAKRLAEFEASGMPIPAAATGAPASASAVSAGAQKAPAPTSGPWAIPANFKTPLVRTLKLADGVDMDFCAIPAGTFNMANDGNGGKGVGGCHKVTITRPFWFSKSLVTARQFMEIKPTNAEMAVNVKEIEKLFPEHYVCHDFLQEDADLFLKGLNKKFAAILPKGYVFRLPTDAEWEYVLYGDYEGDNRDRGWFWRGGKYFNELYDQKNAKWRECRLMPRSPLNKWGVIGKGSSDQMILDKIDVQGGGVFTKIPYNAEEVDPLREGSRYLTRVAYAVHCQRKQQYACLFHVVIGPDLVGEKKAGLAVEKPVPVVAAGAQKAPAPTASPQAIPAEIKTHTIKLNNTVSMEFVECPAGTFMMGRDTPPYNKTSGENGANVMRHKVTITRPFWIGKYLVTREEWGVYRPKDVLKKDLNALEKAIGGMKAPCCNVSYDDAMKFCSYLTKKYGAMIPNGYVFRLPSEAEWEYALRANATDKPNNPYGDTFGHPKSSDDIKDVGCDRSLLEELEKKGFKFNNDKKCILGGKAISIPPPAAGRKIPNPWGLYSMVGSRQWMLDTVKEKTTLDYAAEETDPLRQYGKNDARAIVRGELWWTWMVKGFPRLDARNGHDLCIRLVVGPDLVAEKKAGKK